jgi:hypothetical protein
MGSLWLVVFGLGNLAIVGLWLYMFGLHETPPPTGKPLSRDGQQALRLLQELAIEIAERAEDNAGRLEDVARELVELAGMAAALSQPLKRRSREQAEFAAYLRKSSEKLRKHSSRFGVLPSDGKARRVAESPGRSSAETAISETPTPGDVGADLVATPRAASEHRRGEDREPTSFALFVLPLDSSFEPDGEPFAAVAREVSTGGMSFSHTSALSSPHVAIRITLGDDQDNFLVMDCRHSSSAGPMLITGGAFLRRLEDGPARRILTDFAALSEMNAAQEQADQNADLAVW